MHMKTIKTQNRTSSENPMKTMKTKLYSTATPARRPRAFFHLLAGGRCLAALAAAALLLPATQAAPAGLSPADWAAIDRKSVV